MYQIFMSSGLRTTAAGSKQPVTSIFCFAGDGYIRTENTLDGQILNKSHPKGLVATKALRQGEARKDLKTINLHELLPLLKI